MKQDRITLIISDLHVGAGTQDKGDDHVFDKNQLVGYLDSQALTPEGQAGGLELFINGDFLEFAQTNVEAFSHLRDDAWCTEQESLVKLNTIIAGHPEIFDALKRFQASGNLVTIAAGNHDVDLYWPKVQDRLKEVAGDLDFEVGKDWIERHGGKLQIAHGHMNDVANSFKDWAHPFVGVDFGVERLEMCPGTLFMVKFVNRLEAKYPFADNLLPVTKLTSVLWSDSKAGFTSVAWMFARFLATTSSAVLGIRSESDYGKHLLQSFIAGGARSGALIAKLAANKMHDEALMVKEQRLTEARLAELMFTLLGRIEMADWQLLFELPMSGTTLGSEPLTLSALNTARNIDDKVEFRRVAEKRKEIKKAAVVVMGHTHVADHVLWPDGQYFNPGSWTRYLQLAESKKVTLDDLREESKYPYALNVVRVEPTKNGLDARMDCIDKYVV